MTPRSLRFEVKESERADVPGHAVVPVVPAHHCAQMCVLVADGHVPVPFAPLACSLERASETLVAGLVLQGPSTFARLAPVVREAEQVEAPPVRHIVIPRRGPLEIYDPCLVGMPWKTVLLKAPRQYGFAPAGVGFPPEGHHHV